MLNLTTTHSITIKKWELLILSIVIAFLPPIAAAITTQASTAGLITTGTASTVMGIINFIYLYRKSIVLPQ